MQLAPLRMHLFLAHDDGDDNNNNDDDGGDRSTDAMNGIWQADR